MQALPGNVRGSPSSSESGVQMFARSDGGSDLASARPPSMAGIMGSRNEWRRAPISRASAVERSLSTTSPRGEPCSDLRFPLPGISQIGKATAAQGRWHEVGPSIPRRSPATRRGHPRHSTASKRHSAASKRHFLPERPPSESFRHSSAAWHPSCTPMKRPLWATPRKGREAAEVPTPARRCQARGNGHSHSGGVS